MKFIKNLYNKFLLKTGKRNLPVQDVFNIVIDGGFYSQDNTVFMCNALHKAYWDDFISCRELVKCTEQIEGYIGRSRISTLETKLKHNSLPHNFEHRLAIYRDWANRPVLSK